MVTPPRIPRGNVRERRLAQFISGLASRVETEIVLENFTESPDTRPGDTLAGRLIFASDTKKVQVFDGAAWVNI